MVVSNKYFQSMSLKIIIYKYRVEHEISRGREISRGQHTYLYGYRPVDIIWPF